MKIGQNKLALKTYKKNILPPFENEGWTTNTGFSPTDLFKEGYNISFTAPQYQGVNIYLPDSLAGKTLSLSAEYAEGILPWIEIIFMPMGGTNPVYRGVNAKTTKIEGYAIPFGATGIRVKISSTATGTNLVAFTNLQLEIGDKCTTFEEMYEMNEAPNKGLVFDGKGVVNVDNMTTFLSAERDFSMEVTFTPKSTAKKSLEELLFGWSGWHEGILYNSVDNQIRVQVHFKNISTGTVGRDIVQTPVPVGRRTTATMVYKSSNRQISIFIDGVLKQRVISGYADKSVYSFNTYATGLTFGATYGLTYAFNGVVEGGKLWDRSLTDEEVSKGLEPKPILNYDFTNQDPTSLNPKDLVSKNNSSINGAKYLQKASKKVPAKNLFDVKAFDANKTVGGGTMWMYSVIGKPNTKYMVSTNMPYTEDKGYANLYAGGVSTDSNGVKDGSPRQVTTGSGGGIPLYVRNQTTSSEASDAYDKLVSGKYWIQVEEGTVATDHADFKLINRLNKDTSLKKVAYKDYPFTFTRDGSIPYGNKLFNRNQPRIDDKGILIEDGTINLASKANWGQYTIRDDGEDIVDDIKAHKFTTFRTDNPNHRGCKYVEATAGKTYSASCLVKYSGAGVITISSNKPYPEGGNTISVSEAGRVIPLGNDWYRVELVSKIVSNTVPNCILTVGVSGSNVVLGESFWVANLQWEAKGYPTSYCDSSRSRENLAITNAGRYIDTQKGSIELEFTPLSEDNTVLASETWGAHDLATYVAGAGGFILRRSYTKANRIELVVVSPASGINLMGYADTVGWKNGDSMKYRLEWDVTANTTTVTINDSYVLRVASCFKMFDPSYIFSLTVGSRGLITDSYGCGNAIYSSLIIRNRNGETVYKL